MTVVLVAALRHVTTAFGMAAPVRVFVMRPDMSPSVDCGAATGTRRRFAANDAIRTRTTPLRAIGPHPEWLAAAFREILYTRMTRKFRQYAANWAT